MSVDRVREAPAVVIDGRRLPIVEGATVLETLEASGIDAASGCRAGTCMKCVLRTDSPLPVGSQKGLREPLVREGAFVSCQTRPTGDIVLRGAAAPVPLDAHVRGVETVSKDVARVFLEPASTFEYAPGQYLDVIHPTGAKRSYSIASLPASGLLELHVRAVPGGLVSSWLHGRQPGDHLSIQGPFGQCYYLPTDPAQPLLLVGAGTGLSPLLGIARDALEQGHTGPIDLVHGGLIPERLYLQEELRAFAREAPSLRVHHCVLKEATPHEHEGPLDQVALKLAGAQAPDAARKRAFLCGDDAIVRTLQRSFFLAGVPSREIFADPFTPAVS